MTVLDTSVDSLYTELEMFNSMSGCMTRAMSTDSIDDVEKPYDEEEVFYDTCTGYRMSISLDTLLFSTNTIQYCTHINFQSLPQPLA